MSLRRLRASPTLSFGEQRLLGTLGSAVKTSSGNLESRGDNHKARFGLAEAGERETVKGPWRKKRAQTEADRDAIQAAVREAGPGCENRAAVARSLFPQTYRRVRHKGRSWVARFQFSGEDICGPPRSARNDAYSSTLDLSGGVQNPGGAQNRG